MAKVLLALLSCEDLFCWKQIAAFSCYSAIFDKKSSNISDYVMRHFGHIPAMVTFLTKVKIRLKPGVLISN